MSVVDSSSSSSLCAHSLKTHQNEDENVAAKTTAKRKVHAQTEWTNTYLRFSANSWLSGFKPAKNTCAVASNVCGCGRSFERKWVKCTLIFLPNVTLADAFATAAIIMPFRLNLYFANKYPQGIFLFRRAFIVCVHFLLFSPGKQRRQSNNNKKQNKNKRLKWRSQCSFAALCTYLLHVPVQTTQG